MICTLNAIEVIVPLDDGMYVFKVDSDGAEKDEGKYLSPNIKITRTYRCTNCGFTIDGGEDFTIREHLGKFNKVIDPFEN